ncbi:phosphotransferase enzyme family protein [Nonomuraea insulae]|uniref:Phosphotransferase enzyme family protein n=1 Tax=Nonomuraea insulae TaxID=1616787 RepID=A0ABW1D0F6_9ACTN
MGIERLVHAYGLGDLERVTPLLMGSMNRSWRADTTTGSYAVKQFLDVDVERALRQHTIAKALADKGFPVPRPVELPDGEPHLMLEGHPYSVVEWADGEHPDCTELSLDECRSIGTLLGELQLALAELLPETPRYGSTPSRDPALAFGQIERYLAQIDALEEPDAFDHDVRDGLHERRDLLRRWLPGRPVEAERGPYGWSHGDFHQNNFLWANGSVSAVIDWDRLRISLLGLELVRSASFMFGAHTSHAPDLRRVSAYATGYRDVIDVTDQDIADAADHRWWHNLTGLWPLDARYERGDTSCDRFFQPSHHLLVWWCDHRAEFTQALLG